MARGGEGRNESHEGAPMGLMYSAQLQIHSSMHDVWELLAFHIFNIAHQQKKMATLIDFTWRQPRA